ncbi:MAG: DUF362 domain-containing protein [Spirochaetales bacterium]|nr:DUF362 domain-containing protein [Spirochaetales bacterium]
MQTVYLARCAAYDIEPLCELVERLLAPAAAGRFRSGERIWVKPNLLAAHEPDKAVTTHPALVEAVLRFLKARGVTPVLADSPGGVVRSPARVYRATGMAELARRTGVELLHLETAGAAAHVLSDGTPLYLSSLLDRVDGIVNLPKLKTHSLMLSTFALKNLYGVIPGFRKGEYHKLYPTPRRFAWLLAELYDRLRPKVRLNLVDGIWGMDGNGPSAGNAKPFGLIAAAGDAVALDAALERLLGFRRPSPLARELERRGWLVPAETRWVGPRGNDLPRMQLPANWYMSLTPRWMARLLGRAVEVYPDVDPEKCVMCGDCMRACPVGAISMEPGLSPPRFDYQACIRCLCCQELCPESAVGFRKTRLARRLSERGRNPSGRIVSGPDPVKPDQINRPRGKLTRSSRSKKK